MMKFLYNLFGHTCRFKRTDIIVYEYKNAYIKLFTSIKGKGPVHFEEVKDIKPKCVYCGKPLPEEL